MNFVALDVNYSVRKTSKSVGCMGTLVTKFFKFLEASQSAGYNCPDVCLHWLRYSPVGKHIFSVLV